MVGRYFKIFICVGTLVVAVSTSAKAELHNEPPDLFRDQLDDINQAYSACIKNQDFIRNNEKGYFIPVPIDYHSPSRGTFRLYAYFKKSYDPKKPTAIYFDGGPGGNSHTQPAFSREFNELRFDQRGVACSQPEDPRVLVDSKFYSSEFIARDAEKIREYLGLDKISIYGGSYGTIPATIYASLFSKRTRAVVLEGTVFREKNKYFDPFFIRKIERVYENLPSTTRKSVDQFFFGVRSIYFAQVVHRFLDSNFGSEEATRYITALFGTNEKYDETKVKRAVQSILSISDLDGQTFTSRFNPNYPSNLDLFRSLKLLNLFIIDCKEMPEYVDSLNTELSLEKGRFISLKIPRESFCQRYQIPVDVTKFQASDYRIAAPVTYFQGYNDGRTLVAGALRHFVQVPLGRAQFLVAGNGGHAPLLSTLLSPPSREVRKLHEKALDLALNGETIPTSLLAEMNTQVPVQWEQSLRDQNSIFQSSPLVLRPLP